MIIGISGKSLTSDESRFIVDNNIGGLILFDRNLESPQQIHDLCRQIQDLRHRMTDKAPLFISIDMEGGRVHRLKPPFTKWPAMRKLGDIDSTSGTFKLAQMMGSEMRAVGINLDYAPCIDVFTNPKNTVIGDRALSDDPEKVSRLASALVRGFIKADVLPCAKHFPGHGNTLLDSHLDLPVEEADLQRLTEVELVPFKKTFRARLDLVMTAHIRFPNIDPEWPVTLSEIFLKKILRESLRYRNLVMTDDLDMQALTKHYDKHLIPVRALQAGANILLYCNDPSSPPLCLEAVEKALKDKTLSETVVDSNHQQVLALKKEKLSQPDPLEMTEVSKIVGHPDHLRLAKSISEGHVPEDMTVT
jgi:beta-N-acetylhexosaminidase